METAIKQNTNNKGKRNMKTADHETAAPIQAPTEEKSVNARRFDWMSDVDFVRHAMSLYKEERLTWNNFCKALTEDGRARGALSASEEYTASAAQTRYRKLASILARQGIHLPAFGGRKDVDTNGIGALFGELGISIPADRRFHTKEGDTESTDETSPTEPSIV